MVAAEGLIELQGDVLAVMQGIDMDGNQTLDWREFLAASMERSVFLRESYMRKVSPGVHAQLSIATLAVHGSLVFVHDGFWYCSLVT